MTSVVEGASWRGWSALLAIADFLKLAKDLSPSCGQLMAKTMPLPQWLAAVLAACAQKNHMGLVWGSNVSSDGKAIAAKADIRP